MDNRTLREKLQAMAERGTEHEREIAQTKLDAMGAGPPRRPPTAVGAAGLPADDWTVSGTTWTAASATMWTGYSSVHVTHVEIRFG